MKSLLENLLRDNRCVILFLCVAAFMSYAFMLSGSFKTIDDPALIIHNPDLQSFAHVGKIFSTPLFEGGAYYRPLLVFYYMMVYHLFGPNPFFFNLVNLLLHIGVAVSIFFLVRGILQSREVGFLTSLLFVLHPLHWEVVCMNLTDTILCAFFYINAFYFFWRYNETKAPFYYYLFSLVLFSLALLSKENAIVLLLLMVASYILFSARRLSFREGAALFIRRVAPFLIVLLFYVLLRQVLGITHIFYWPSFKASMLAFVMLFKLMLTNIWLTIMPIGLHFYRIERIFQDFNIEVLGIVGLFFVLFILFIKNRKILGAPVIFFFLWFLIGLLPFSQVIPIGVQPGYVSMAERQMYISSVGIFVLLVLLAKSFCHWMMCRKMVSKKILAQATAGWFLFLLLTTMSQSVLASNKITVYRQSLAHNPDNIRIWYALGLEYANRRSFVYAEQEFRKMLVFDPQDVRARIALGKALCDQGRYLEGDRKSVV